MLACELGEGEEAEGGEVGDGFVEVPDEVGEVDGVVEEGELELVVVGAEEGWRCVRASSSSLLGVFAEADAEGLDGLGVELLGHERDDEARVEASGEHCAERDVAHESQPHCFA